MAVVDVQGAPRHYLLAAALAGSMGIGAFTVHGISALAPIVLPELGMSRTQLGSLATLTFFVSALGSMYGGRLVDQVGSRTGITLVYALGLLSTLAMTTATGLVWLWIGAAFAGLAHAIANPATNHLIAQNIPAGSRGAHVGVKQSGVQIAQTLAGLGLPPLAVAVGWRYAMSSGILLALAGIAVTAYTVGRTRYRLTRHRRSQQAPLGGDIIWLTVIVFVMGLTVQPVLVYSPLYAFEQLGNPAALAGMYTGVVGGVGVFSRILWGRYAERHDSPKSTILVLSLIALTGTLAIVASGYVGSWALVVGLALFGASAIAAPAVAMLAIMGTVTGASTGRASGVVGLGLFLGYMLGPISFALIVDTGGYTLAWSVLVVLFLLVVGLASVWRAER